METSVELQEPNKLQTELREKSLASLYFFSKAVLGYKDLTSIHQELCAFLEAGCFDTIQNGNPKGFSKLVVLPRGHLKSSLCTIAYPIWRALHNPNIRILISNATATNASHFLRAIAGHFEENEIFRWLFPELIPEKGATKWTSTELEIVRSKVWPEATFECIGVGGTAVSRHYDLQIEDDLVAGEHLESSEQMQKIIDWHKYALSLSVSPVSLQKVVVGTRWAFNDLISFILHHEKHYSIFYRSATDNYKLNEESKPVWPERFSVEVLRQIQSTQGPRIFATQYMNEPLFDDPDSFDMSIIRRFRSAPHESLTFFTAVDPALGTEKGDYSAIVTVGRNHLHDIYCVEAQRGRWSIDVLIDKMFDTWALWGSKAVGLETIFFQKVLMFPIREAMRRRQQIIPIEELRPNSKHIKTARIAAIRPYFVDGSLWLKEGLVELEKELEEFPRGAHDDTIDALAYAVQMARPSMAPEVPKDRNPFLLDNILEELQTAHAAAQKETTWYKSQR